MRRFLACTMAMVLVTTATTPGFALARTVELPSGATAGCIADTGQRPDAAAKWKEKAQRIPLGKTIKINTASGETLKGVLRAAGDTSITVELNTANAVRPVEVPYSEIQKLERQGLGWGAKITIIACVVGAAMIYVFIPRG